MKKFLIIVSGLIFMIVLHGCTGLSEPAIQFEGEQQPVSRVENIMADQIEVENPDLDVRVQLMINDEDN